MTSVPEGCHLATPCKLWSYSRRNGCLREGSWKAVLEPQCHCRDPPAYLQPSNSPQQAEANRESPLQMSSVVKHDHAEGSVPIDSLLPDHWFIYLESCLSGNNNSLWQLAVSTNIIKSSKNNTNLQKFIA